MPYCKALYNHVAVSTSGNIRPCCYYKNSKNFNIKNITLNDYMQSPYLAEIRNNMKTGWDPGCAICKNDVESGRFSMMESINLGSVAEEFTIDSIEITTNNICNFRCRTCSSDSSSKWGETLGEPLKFKKNNVSRVLDNLDLTKINNVKVMGGEPFITSDLENIIESILDSGNDTFTLHTSTNLSFFPRKMLNSISKIKNFMIVFSIDGVGELNNYIRHDSDWNTVESNLTLWLEFLRSNIPTHKAYIHTVAQAYNYHDLKKIKEFCDQYSIFHSTQLIDSPIEFTINALPPEYINFYKDDYNNKFLNNYKFNEELFALLKNTTQFHDMLLGKKIQHYIPELYKYFI